MNKVGYLTGAGNRWLSTSNMETTFLEHVHIGMYGTMRTSATHSGVCTEGLRMLDLSNIMQMLCVYEVHKNTHFAEIYTLQRFKEYSLLIYRDTQNKSVA